MDASYNAIPACLSQASLGDTSYYCIVIINLFAASFT